MTYWERRDAIAEFLTHLALVPGYLFEIRGLGRGEDGIPRSLSAICDDPVQAAGLAIWMADKAYAVYFTINPIAPTSQIAKAAARNKIHKAPRDEDGKRYGPRAASDEDIAFRRLLLIDIDPTRALGAEGQCSNAEERARARAAAKAIWDWLKDRAWPPMNWVDSGNGLHGYVALPTGTTGAEVETLLRYLSWRFSSPEVHIDTAVGNAARISRLPHTLNLKGQDTEERPWRMAHWLKRQPLVPVPRECITALLEEARVSIPVKREPEHRELDVNEADIQEWIDELEAEGVIDVNNITHKSGSVWWSLSECPFKGGEHEGMDVGCGKTCIVLSKTSLGFTCFADSCSEHGMKDFVRWLKEEHGLDYDMSRIYKETPLDELMKKWGGEEEWEPMEAAHERTSVWDLASYMERQWREQATA